MTKKLLKKKKPPVNSGLMSQVHSELKLVPFSPNTEITRLDRLLADSKRVAELDQNCQLGASVGTLAGIIGVSPDLLKKWIHRGREESFKYDPEYVITPYMKLWDLLSKSWAKARLLAEANLQNRDPEKFLKSKTAKLLGDDWEDDSNAAEEDDHQNRLQVGDKLLESFKNLRKQGFDLNDIIDNDTLQIKIDPPKKKEKDILAANGLVQSGKSSLPEIFDTPEHIDSE